MSVKLVWAVLPNPFSGNKWPRVQGVANFLCLNSGPDWESMGALTLDVVLPLTHMFHHCFTGYWNHAYNIMLHHFPALHQCLWHTGPYLSMNWKLLLPWECIDSPVNVVIIVETHFLCCNISMLFVCRCLGSGVVELKIFRKIQRKSLLPHKFSDSLLNISVTISNS